MLDILNREIVSEFVEGYAKSGIKMDTLTERVHDEVLSDKFLDKYLSKIDKILEKILYLHQGIDILDKTLIGKLKYKLPMVDIGDGWNSYSKEKSKLIFATLVVQMVLEMGSLQFREERKREVVEGKTKFTTQKYVLIPEDLYHTEPKDLLQGIEFSKGSSKEKYLHTKVGAKQIKLNTVSKNLLKNMGNQEFKLSDFAEDSLIYKGYTLTRAYNNALRGISGESSLQVKARYSKYLETIRSLDGAEFFLTNWLDSRGRLYYHCQLEGIRPQGKLWETQMIDSAKGYVIDEKGYKHLAHLIVCNYIGKRLTVESAVEYFENNVDAVIDYVDALDPYALEYDPKEPKKAIDKFGEIILLKKLMVAFDCYSNDEECYYLFGKDMTNSGIGLKGLAFREPKMFRAGNYGTTKEVADSHTVFGDAYGLDRSIIKPIHTALLHGGTFKAMAEDLKRVIFESKADEITESKGLKGLEEYKKSLEWITESYVKESAIKAYGHSILNLGSIAEWGGSVVSNYNTSLTWRSISGQLVTSSAYMQKVPLDIYTFSMRNKSGYSRHKLTADMPLLRDSKGSLVFNKEDEVTIRKRGLDANITHSVDSELRRRVEMYCLNSKHTIMTKHDDFMTELNAFDRVITVIADFAEEVNTKDPFADACEQIATHIGKGVKPPHLIYGSDDAGDHIDIIRKSKNFLMA